MTKRRRPPAKIEEHRDLTEESLSQAMVEMHEIKTPSTHKPLGLSLDEIRDAALKEHSNTAHTIANLEAWRAEIDATIAFLKRK